MYPASFEYFAPTSVSEALSLLAANADAKFIAGGHSLLPAMKLRLATPAALIDLGGIAEMKGITDAGDKIAIGALATHCEVERSALMKNASPLMSHVASHIGDAQVRNLGTIGGSIAHADPAADYPAALLALGAVVQVQGANGTRSINADDLFTGIFATSIGANEIVTAVHVPKTNAKGNGVAYAKFPHPASRYAIAGVAVWVNIKDDIVQDIRIGVTGAADHAQRASKAEAALQGKPMNDDNIAAAAAAASDGLTTMGDLFASGEYRAHLVNTLALDALNEAHHAAHGWH